MLPPTMPPINAASFDGETTVDSSITLRASVVAIDTFVANANVVIDVVVIADEDENVIPDWVELSVVIAANGSIVGVGLDAVLDAVLGVGLGVGLNVGLGVGLGVGRGVGRGVGLGDGGGVGRGVGRGVGLAVTQTSHVTRVCTLVQSRQLLSTVMLRCKMLIMARSVSAATNPRSTYHGPANPAGTFPCKLFKLKSLECVCQRRHPNVFDLTEVPTCVQSCSGWFLTICYSKESFVRM